ncbi:RagB/SusD family nutrient uptake outer membrane protein [Mangrovibacterium marinum]|uniref:Putative outer membrane starch-binding protein n=1 Tax=Mangrovibacterium marinum TaxID=1639118 RepID=A0A2T5BYN1_9BACT|nr:RagB/SusD family nutrient uptake outer membrane protein [Mangrovibacterium marinum]PTN07355.1 putative outer membrane starch-binding protein [Mangrovibacterium marinum]
MKKIKIFCAAILLGGIALTSCVDDFAVGDSFLEKQPGVDVTQDTIFNSAEYARRFLWNDYSKLYYGLPIYWNSIDNKMNMGMFETLSDCWHSHLSWDGVNRHYYSGSYSAGTESGSDTRFGYTNEETWEAIRQSWIFIENVDRVPDMDEAEKKRLKAEAKVIIASRYFDMFRHYGGLPILDHAIQVSNDASAYQFERGTVDATVTFMTQLLDQAAADLPWSLDAADISNWDGRFTRAAAMALKCKVLLFAASPLFNDSEPYCTEGPQEAVTNLQVWYGAYKPELWTELLQACESFFTELNQKGVYGLVQAAGTSPADYRTAFRNAYFTRGSGAANPEMLISTRVRYTYGSNWQWNYYFPQSNMNGAFTPTQEYVEMFPMADGTPFDWDDPNDVANMFTQRDPRLFETILVEGASYQGRQAELWVGGREARQNSELETGQYATGYANYKFILDFSANLNKPTLWPYLRLSEVYLIYAEALLKAGRTGEAINMVDQVRARVGMGGLEASNPDKNLSDADVLMEEILRERACELGLEDVRLFDLIRNKRADLFQKQLHGLRIYRADGVQDSWSDKDASTRGPRPTEFTYSKFELTNAKRAWWTSFSPKWYLAAFPPVEVNKGYGLTQNPGW